MYRRRYIRRVTKKGKRNLIISIILVSIILYAGVFWALPNFVGALGVLTSFLKPQTKIKNDIAENPHLAPPVFNITYEATNTAQISIAGFSTPLSKVNLYIDDTLKQTEDVSKEGKFLFEGVELSLGTNNIFGKTEDEKNQESLPSKTIRVIFDNEKPPLQILGPNDNMQIQGERKVTIEGQTEIDAKVYINNSQIIVGKDGLFKSDQSLNDGENIFIIKAFDKASNWVEVERRVNLTP